MNRPPHEDPTKSPDVNFAGAPTDDEGESFEPEEGLSLEELSQSYANALGRGPLSQPAAANEEGAEGEETALGLFDPLRETLDQPDTCPVTPLSILEAILFVGRPDSGAIAAAEIAALMRGVQESEIADLVMQLNEVYVDTGRVTRIVPVGNGYKVELAPELNSVRDRFYGPSREVRLNQAAIDCLALVSYQPGITRDMLEQQRGQPSGTVLNQLVRRELLEMRRESDGTALKPHYYPTQRLVELAGLASLDDLPHAEEWQ